MSASEELRFVRFEDPHAFLDATKAFDDSFMNFSFGSLHDYISSPQYDPADPSKPVHLLSIFRGDDLLLNLSGFHRISITHIASDYAWLLCVPTTAGSLLTGTPTTPGLLAPAVSLLATSTLAALPPDDPLFLDKLIGPSAAVDAFLAAWSALLLAHGLRVRANPNVNFDSRVSYVTLASLSPSPSPSPSPASPCVYPTVQATPADLEPLAQLYIAFQAATPWRGVVAPEAARAFLSRPIAAGFVWYTRFPDSPEPVGYVLAGRATRRTISIRNVFVLPQHRRRGIAEALVRGVARYYLDAWRDSDVRPVQDGPPAIGYKAEVNLNVADDGAERVYRRVGFLFPERSADGSGEVRAGGVDPSTGRTSWYASVWRGIERVPEPEAEPESQTQTQ